MPNSQEFSSNPRVRVIFVSVIALTLATLLLGGSYFLILRKMIKHELKAEKKLAEQQAILDELLLYQNNQSTYQKSNAALLKQLQETNEQIPSFPEVPDLLDKLAAVAQTEHLTLEQFAVQPIQEVPQELNTLSIEIQVVGTYENLLHFLQGLTQFPRIIHLTDLVITPQAPSTKAGGALIAKITLATYFIPDEAAK